MLVLGTLGAAVSVATWRAEAVAEISIQEALGRVPDLFANYLSNLEALHREKLRSIAEAPGTKSIFAAGDTPTRWEFASDVARLHEAKTVFLFDRSSAVIARSDKPVGEGTGQPFGSVRWVADVLDLLRDSSAVIREKGDLCVVASTPVLSGEAGEQVLNGVLAASFPLDKKRVRQLQTLTQGEVGFLVDLARRGEPSRIAVAAGTTGLGGDAFVSAFSRAGAADAATALFSRGTTVGPIRLDVAGDKRIVLAVPIRSSTNETLGAMAVSRSMKEETATFRRIRNTFFGVGLGALLFAIPLSFAVGRGIARPIEQLAATAGAIREGNLSVEMPQGGSGEVGALARAFGQMLAELRQKAALEELVAEMNRKSDEARLFPAAASPATGTAPSHASGREGRPELKAGEILGGRYQILGPIGKGGMGVVYRALDRELEDEIALKLLYDTVFGLEEQAVQALKNEIKIARRITHPNVVRTHDLGEADGIRFLTMEYVKGRTLRELLDLRGALAPGPGLQICKQLLRGLAAVHGAKILHSDLKPHNVMVLPNGVVKIMDFGIASFVGSGAMNDKLIVGTPQYMSPEQIEGLTLDVRSDLYSVGTIMFEVFTGRKPFEAGDLPELIAKRRTHDPPSPTQLAPGLPRKLERIILSLLKLDPKDRPASTRQVYTDLMNLAV